MEQRINRNLLSEDAAVAGDAYAWKRRLATTKILSHVSSPPLSKFLFMCLCLLHFRICARKIQAFLNNTCTRIRISKLSWYSILWREWYTCASSILQGVLKQQIFAAPWPITRFFGDCCYNLSLRRPAAVLLFDVLCQENKKKSFSYHTSFVNKISGWKKKIQSWAKFKIISSPWQTDICVYIFYSKNRVAKFGTTKRRTTGISKFRICEY